MDASEGKHVQNVHEKSPIHLFMLSGESAQNISIAYVVSLSTNVWNRYLIIDTN